MSIDPKLISQLLQLQIASRMDLSGNMDGGQDPQGDGTFPSFADLLQTVLDQAAPAAAGKIVPAAQLLKQMAGSGSRPAPRTDAGGSDAYDPLIEKAGETYGVDDSLIKAVIAAESSFNPNSVSGAGAKGLMQLMDGTAQGYGVTDPFNPQQNIAAGTQYLAGLLDKYKGNEAMALAAYNAGPGRVDRLGVQDDAQLKDKLGQLPQETQAYVSRVQQLKSRYLPSS